MRRYDLAMMLGQEFVLKDWNWKVRVFYIVDLIPIDFIIEELEGIGCSKEDIDLAVAVLDSEDENKGITFSNFNDRESIIVIGETSCPAEFAHSYDHEKLHLAMHIARIDGIDPFSEELAYLAGDISFNMFKVAKMFLCEHCRLEIG